MPKLQDEHCSGESGLTAALSHYLGIIFILQMRDGAARACAIAEMAKVSRSTVTNALKSLSTLKLIKYKPYSLVHLTEAGMGIAHDIFHRHVVFQEFFQDVLGLPSDEFNSVAYGVEHAAPPELTKRLGQFVLFLKSRRELWESWQEKYEKENLVESHAADYMSTTKAIITKGHSRKLT